MTDGAGLEERPQRVDQRTERWREHRAERRREYIDVALRAIEQYGPDVSMEDIAAEAGIAKPKLYRFVTDRANLMQGVAERLGEIVKERLARAMNPYAPPAQIIREGLDAWLGVVDDHPVAFSLLVQSFMTDRRLAETAIADGRQLAEGLGILLATEMKAAGVSTETAELWGTAMVGSVGASTLWWAEHRAITKQEMIDRLAPLLWAGIDAIARSMGVVIADPEKPFLEQLLAGRAPAPE